MHNLPPGHKIIAIVGPTASGKSDLAIKLAKKYGGEIISADSRQVYAGMDIGTGKVRRDSIKYKVLSIRGKKINPEFYSEGIRHHLLDIADPKKLFTADDFKKLGERAVKEITAGGKIPIIVGGTGFYIDILLGRMQVAQVPPNPKLRAKLEKQSAEQLFKQLTALDPQRAVIIDRHNKRRLVRALEIIITTKKSSLNTKYKIPDTKYETLWLGVYPEKEKLAENIKKRLDKRLDQGMIKEVQKLHGPPAGGGVSWKRLDNLGLEYRWVSRWLIKNAKIKNQNDNSKFNNSEEYKNLLRDIIRYSKRQMTWFKRNKDIHWIKNQKEAGRLYLLFLGS